MESLSAFYEAMPPIIQNAVNCGLLAAFALLALCFLKRKRYKVILFVVALVCSIPAMNAVLHYYPELVDARFRTYKQFYAELAPGMSKEDIIFTEEKYYPVGGERTIPTTASDSPTFMSFAMNPEDSPGPKNETINLRLRDGKLVAKEYVME